MLNPNNKTEMNQPLVTHVQVSDKFKQTKLWYLKIVTMARAIGECNSKLLMLSEVSYNSQEGKSVELSFDHGSRISSISLLNPLFGRVNTDDLC